ncbi:heme utilization protein, partial [Ursidibacter sp. B-7004-1]
MAQGILATTLTLTAQTLNNQQGKMHSRSQSELNVNQQIDNRQGEITGDNAVHITGNELQLNNQAGKLQAGGKLSIFANAVTTNGHIEGQDIELTQQRDFITGNPIHANNNLSITTSGNLVNQHQLYADDSVKLNANHITNHLNGRISSANTQLTARGDVHNEGLINSVSPQDNAQTIVKANGRIVNTGEGRIYGDHIALQADRIENSDKDYGSGKITSAVVAARGNLDIAAREIENNTAHYLADNQVGATLFSMGNMRFGRVLNLNNQAEGQAEVLRNNSSVLEAEGNIQLNANQIDNNNTHFSAHHLITGQTGDAITLLSKSQNLMEVFIIPEGHHIQNFYENEKNSEKGVIVDQPDPRISVKNLKWVGWSRAGQYIYTNDGAESSVIKHESDISSDKFLASFHDWDCNEKNVCQISEAGDYKKDNPIWTYFGIIPPKEDAPVIPLIEMPEEWFDEKGEFVPPIQPSKPSIPREQDFIMGRDGDLDYSGYERAMSKYREDLATYETNLKNYQYYKDNFKDYEDWGNKYKESIDKLDTEIEKHNDARIAKLNAAPIRKFWKISINNRRFDESKVLTTVPAQILAGGYLNFDSSSFTNNRSSVISGETIALKGNIDNKDEQGRHRVTDSGKSQWSYSRWRGGFKRYHQRKWDRENDYTRIIETPFDMNIFRIDENANYADNPLISNEHKEGATHHLSLSRLKVKGGAFSAQANQALGSLTHHDNAQFIGFNTSIQLLPNGQGRQLSRIELSNKTEIRSIQPNLVIPQNVLYRVNTNPTNRVLIETDPDFTNNKRWLSSEYMFNALRYEPNTLQKRLGDGFYEQRLVREQINRLTGRQFVGNYTDFNSQYRGLMNAGITFAQKFNLRPGITLSANQVAQLTTDIVWLESEKIRLPNGQVENVLVPKVYAVVKKGDITGNGTLLSGNSVKHSGGEFINNGTVAGRELVRFDSDSIRNSGNIQAGAITGNISGNLENIGGVIEADRA